MRSTSKSIDFARASLILLISWTTSSLVSFSLQLAIWSVSEQFFGCAKDRHVEAELCHDFAKFFHYRGIGYVLAIPSQQDVNAVD